MSPEATGSGITSFAPKPVDVASIERELAQLWEFAHEGEETVTRACMSNVIVFCATQEQANVIPQEIPTIVQLHPARLVLLVAETESHESTIEASVSAHCHLVGGGRQICSEHVTVRATGNATQRLPSAARSLLIGDLPTALWWAPNQAPPLGGGLFRELAEMADQIIYDSLGWPDPVAGVVATAQWAADAEQIVSDLEWRRLKPWRRLVGQALDPAVVPGALESITEVELEHGPHALPQAWLLIGWLACRLGWQPCGGKVTPGETVTWRFDSPHGPIPVTVRRLKEAEAGVRSMKVTWNTEGRPVTATFAFISTGRLAAITEGTAGSPRVMTAPRQSRSILVAKQLPDLGRDPLFRSTLDVSRTMAEALQ